MKRLWAVLRLVAVGVWQISRANLRLASLILNPARSNRPRFVRVPIRLRREISVAALANLITLTPGTLTVDVAPDRSSLLVHVFDLEEEGAAVAEIQNRLERAVAEVFE
ncbi:MAG: Na+/H+ antiporter subunit E [Armatimonadota bacterium]|nr:Na+/H+ antiporter subunit E [Armatimonadota bacterium]MDR7392455.1 Na+/H+ antiporter subunit E [Armatimonadota bacterium]MDR7599999.1 Na+/H+ antiporter subunit E [Armatimonadota bacterium]